MAMFHELMMGKEGSTISVWVVIGVSFEVRNGHAGSSTLLWIWDIEELGMFVRLVRARPMDGHIDVDWLLCSVHNRFPLICSIRGAW